jgi:hypothetical protein
LPIKIGEGSPSRVDHNHFYPHIGKRMMGTPRPDPLRYPTFK